MLGLCYFNSNRDVEKKKEEKRKNYFSPVRGCESRLINQDTLQIRVLYIHVWADLRECVHAPL